MIHTGWDGFYILYLISVTHCMDLDTYDWASSLRMLSIDNLITYMPFVAFVQNAEFRRRWVVSFVLESQQICHYCVVRRVTRVQTVQ